MKRIVAAGVSRLTCPVGSAVLLNKCEANPRYSEDRRARLAPEQTAHGLDDARYHHRCGRRHCHGQPGIRRKSLVEAQIASLGQNVILVFSGSVTRGGLHTGWGSAGTLTIEDATAIQREVAGVVAVSPEVRTVSQVAAGNQNWYTQIFGESQDYLDLRQWPLSEGAMFTEQDVRSANKVAIIGQTTARQLYGDGSAMGQVIRVKSVPFIITGQLVAKGLSVAGPIRMTS